MDNRLYFVLSDLFSNMLIGMLVGGLCWLVVGVDWNMWAAMVLMMVVGMILALVMFFPLGILFGAMEVMLPLMFSGMLAGMVVGMWIPMSALMFLEAAIIGAMSGLLGLVVVWILNTSLRGLVVLAEVEE